MCIYIAQDANTGTSCNGVQGLCSVPLSLVAFPGTHNSAAIKTELSAGGVPGLGALGAISTFWDNQDLSLDIQLKDGIRAFDMDVTFKRISDSEAAALGASLGLSPEQVCLVLCSPWHMPHALAYRSLTCWVPVHQTAAACALLHGHTAATTMSVPFQRAMPSMPSPWLRSPRGETTWTPIRLMCCSSA